ncbi:MAG: efflux RND transporter periplasmic adaptor subunit [Prevotella sp.]|nr:efflux RND transporter periplasmic adaptor subunit [Prevotella sp.]
MKKNIKRIVAAVAAMAVIGGLAYMVYSFAHGATTDEKDGLQNVEREEAVIEVDTMALRRQTFQKQVLCNGRLTAIRRAELMCPKAGEILQSVNVRNGQHVAAGTILAVADTRERKDALEKARHDLERAKVELQDKLIGLGYDGNTASVPAEKLHRVEVTSGYYSAKFALRSAEQALRDCSLKAPFGGRIADLVARPYQRGDKLCTLIDDSFFDVEFKVLEAELVSVSKGTRVKVSPFVDGELSLDGTVTEINPSVDDKGLVAVKARIKNTSSRLMDGMNVKVIIENSVPDMFVVPKEAVVERDGYNVVFVYNPATSRAVWTYVDILYGNLTSFAITGCERKSTTVKEGDIIITSGNLNLADDTEVKALNKTN